MAGCADPKWGVLWGPMRVWEPRIAILLVAGCTTNPAYETGQADGPSTAGETEPTSGPMNGTRGSGDTSPVDGTTTPPTATGSGEGPLDGSTMPTTADTASTDGPVPVVECCAAHPQGGAGCNSDLEVRDCVCASHPECCTAEWTDACAQWVEVLGCGMCGMNAAACCDAETEDCVIPLVRECVCELDPSCCKDGWTELCVLRGIVDCELTMCEPPSNDCCQPGEEGDLGCDDPMIAHCVCVGAMVPACCEEIWNGSCTATAMSNECGCVG